MPIPISHQQFLPGLARFSKEARPYEQTESQFHNRPDVFVHGRYTSPGATQSPGVESADFHAGSRLSAHERLTTLGAPHTGTVPRFFHGTVNPFEMHNTSNLGVWEGDHPLDFSMAAQPKEGVRDQGGRIADQGTEWGKRHLNRYYRNDYEDKGSTSVVLGTHMEPGPIKRTEGGLQYRDVGRRVPDNFKTWRQGVTNALQFGKPVPGHVRAIYEESGGEHGPHTNIDTEFHTPHQQTVVDPAEAGPGVWKQLQDANHPITRPSNRYSMHDEAIHGFTSTPGMITYGGGYKPEAPPVWGVTQDWQ